MKPYVFSKEKTPDSQSGRFLLLRICFVKSVFTNFSIFDLCKQSFVNGKLTFCLVYVIIYYKNNPRWGCLVV